jgi:prepilin signal peptidase PulO-like enzyme (type II secretory pathway)
MLYVLFALMGLCAGSFVNALVWRIHKTWPKTLNKPKTLSSTSKNRYSILHGRSMCPHCENQLAWYDLLPVISWLSLRGKCRYCKEFISVQYPLVELATAGLFVLSLRALMPVSTVEYLLFMLWLYILSGLIALFIYDLKWMLLPDRLVLPLSLTGVVMKLFLLTGSYSLGTVANAFLGGAIIFGFFYVLFHMSAGKWIGGGDVKLGFLLGLLAGSPVNAFLLLFISSLLGSLVAVPLILSKKAGVKSQLPFGPFLITATIIVYLYGSQIQAFYLEKVLLIQ